MEGYLLATMRRIPANESAEQKPYWHRKSLPTMKAQSLPCEMEIGAGTNQQIPSERLICNPETKIYDRLIATVNSTFIEEPTNKESLRLDKVNNIYKPMPLCIINRAAPKSIAGIHIHVARQ